MDALDEVREGCMASAGKTTANIGIIKSDLHAIIACVTVKGDTRKQVVYMTEDQYSRSRDKIDSKWKINSWRIRTGRREKGRERSQPRRKAHNKRECDAGPTAHVMMKTERERGEDSQCDFASTAKEGRPVSPPKRELPKLARIHSTLI